MMLTPLTSAKVRSLEAQPLRMTLHPAVQKVFIAPSYTQRTTYNAAFKYSPIYIKKLIFKPLPFAWPKTFILNSL
jgi:hypothetical protein